MVDPNPSKSNAQSTQHQVNQAIVDPNYPKDYAGKHISDDDKFKLLTSNIKIPDNFRNLILLWEEDLIRSGLLAGHSCVTWFRRLKLWTRSRQKNALVAPR